MFSCHPADIFDRRNLCHNILRRKGLTEDFPHPFIELHSLTKGWFLGASKHSVYTVFYTSEEKNLCILAGSVD